MHFYSLLKSGVSVEKVALEFVQELLRESWEENELCVELTCDFVNDLLTAIGIECLITPEQINEGGTYVWPMERIQIYSFHYIPLDFQKLEKFLLQTCAIIKLEHDSFLEFSNGYQDEELETPVEYLMQVIAVWCSVYKQLTRMEENQLNKRFEEPLARINFHFLLGMHDLRKLYRTDLYLLDAICNRLFGSALQGLYYKQTHEMIFFGLLKIFRTDFDLFYGSSIPCFFYEAFAVEINTLTSLILYQTLKEILLEIENSNKLNILTNILIEPNMLKVYFSTFMANKLKSFHRIKRKNVEKIQQEALKFLNILQSKLITLDCFSREFLESILHLIFNLDACTSTIACNLYIAMMKRKFSDQMILKHIMDFYVDHVGSVTHLKSYIVNMHESFTYLLTFDNFLEFITDIYCTENIQLLSAHMLVAVFEIKYQESDSSIQQELEHLLQILPEILENMQCQKCEGILLKVYSYIPVEKLQKATLDNFIHYAVGVFSHIDNNLDYTLLMNIFQIFHKFLVYNKEWQHLEIFSEHLLSKYRQMIRDLKIREQEQKELINKRTLSHYNNLLKRLNIVLKTKYELLDNNYLEIIDNLLHYFIYHNVTKALIVEENCLIDTYVLEIVVSLLIKILQTDNVIIQNLTASALVQGLLKYLWSHFKGLNEISKLGILKIKSYYCCLLNVYFHLPLKLDTQDYYQLVHVLIVINFQNKVFNRQLISGKMEQSHPLLSLEYKRLMLRQFTEMHKYQHIQINTNSVWKLCFYYEMFRHPLNDELEKLIVTLANYRPNIYKNIIAVLIYNLYKQSPAVKNHNIVRILKQHKYLIDNVINVDSPALLNIHVVLMVLQILEKALSVQRIKTGHNRLEALKHLHIFIDGLNLIQLQAKQLIYDQLKGSEKYLITVEERKTLENFKMQLQDKESTRDPNFTITR